MCTTICRCGIDNKKGEGISFLKKAFTRDIGSGLCLTGSLLLRYTIS